MVFIGIVGAIEIAFGLVMVAFLPGQIVSAVILGLGVVSFAIATTQVAASKTTSRRGVHKKTGPRGNGP